MHLLFTHTAAGGAWSPQCTLTPPLPPGARRPLCATAPNRLLTHPWPQTRQVGDPLDQKLFAASEWELHDNDEASVHEAAVQQQLQQVAARRAPPPHAGSHAAANGVAPVQNDSQQQQHDVDDLLGVGSLVDPDPLSQRAPRTESASVVDAAAEAAATAAALPPPPPLSWVYPPGAAGAIGGFNPNVASAIVRRFEFSSALQRNLVVVRHPTGAGGGYAVYAKGSPEMIRTLVDQRSVPEDFDRVLGEYTREVRAPAAGTPRVFLGLSAEGWQGRFVAGGSWLGPNERAGAL